MRTEPDIHADGATGAPIAILGFGEAGSAIAEGWREAGLDLSLVAYDLKTAGPDQAAARAMKARYNALGVTGAPILRDALPGARAIFSLVTADAAHDAARAVARDMPEGVFYFDCNSCAPETKRASAALIENAGGRYVDTAIMSPIHPKKHASPMLISGPHALRAKSLMGALGMNARVIEGDVGRASSIKMIRSIMVKGIEALTLECVLSAVTAGVEDEVIASLDASMPGWDWAARSAYNMERTTTHGIRRAAEMREVVRTVADLGLPARMTPATVAWQQNMGELGLTGTPEDYQHRAKAILAALGNAQMEDTP
ncbi:MAG: DUF1932 domain-containing protein [Pseudomonadota bacterium]|nr:DUF1932 domain-containing protein [Pseudomonadota bacterium]